MALSSSATLTLVSTRTETGVPISTPTDALNTVEILSQLSTGSGLNQANQHWYSRRTLNASASENISVVTPSARDSLGVTLALTKIKLVYIRNRNLTAGNDLKVGGEGSSAAWNSPFDGSDTAKTIVGPGGTLLLVAPSAAGFAAAATTNELLKINNVGASSVEYDIIIQGA